MRPFPEPALDALRRLGGPWLARRRSAKRRRAWQARWLEPALDAPWLGRGVSRELVEAVESGWFEAGAPALDLGCGEGDVAAWLSARGFPALGVDVAPAAVERCRRLHGEVPGRLAFRALDLCTERPPGGPYGVLVDRGCLHQLPAPDVARYLRNLHAAAATGARGLLFVRAFRDGAAPGDARERRRVERRVAKALRGCFALERSELTWLDACQGRGPAPALPGLVFWLRRS